MTYRNPFGLAAGMDKRAEALRGWETLGLGFIEIGGVTAEEQTGNPKPRMFRSGTQKPLSTEWVSTIPGSVKIAKQLEISLQSHRITKRSPLGQSWQIEAHTTFRSTR